MHKEDFGLDVEWHFFVSCHGKNACNGIGGTTKRPVTKISLQRTYVSYTVSPKRELHQTGTFVPLTLINEDIQ